MRFTFFKDDAIDVNKLIKSWNDNYFIIEKLRVEESKTMFPSRAIPYYELVVWRNKKFYYFDLQSGLANYLVWKLNLVTTVSETYHYTRYFYNKTAHSKVRYGYISKHDIKYEDEYLQ